MSTLSQRRADAIWRKGWEESTRIVEKDPLASRILFFAMKCSIDIGLLLFLIAAIAPIWI